MRSGEPSTSSARTEFLFQRTALGDFFHQRFGAQTVRTSRRAFDIDNVADRQARRGDMHRLEPGRLADDLAVALAPQFEEQARAPAHSLLGDRLMLFVARGLQA